MRVLHLVDPESPDGGPCTLRLLADVAHRLSTAHHEILILGGRGEAERAARCGVNVGGWVTSPKAAPWAAIHPLRKAMRARRAAGQQCDLVHAWSIKSAAHAHLALAGAVPMLTSLHTGPKQSLATRYAVRVIARNSSLPLLASSMTVRREFRAAGIPAERITLFPPAVDPNRTASIPRTAVRARWQDMAECSISESTFIIALLGEPATWIESRTAATIAARVALSGRTVRLVVHPRAASVVQAIQFMRNLSLEQVIIRDEAVAEPWRILSGIDAALVLGAGRQSRPTPSLLPMLWACSGGVPVVAETCDTLRELIEDGVNGLLVKQQDGNAAADRLARLHDDRALARRLGDAGRTLITDLYGIDDYCERLNHAYELLLADRTVKTLNDAPRQSADVRPALHAAS